MFVNLNLHLNNFLYFQNFLAIQDDHLYHIRIHINWHGQDVLNHFSNFLQGNVLLTILENPMTKGSHHVSNAHIFAAQGVTTPPASRGGEKEEERKHQLIVWGLKLHIGSYYSPKSQ